MTSRDRSSADYVLGLPAAVPVHHQLHKGTHGISRFSRKVLTVHARGHSTTPGPPPLANAGWLVLPSAAWTASAPGAFFLSRLNTRPARSPVNASDMSLRAYPHDSGHCGWLLLQCLALSSIAPCRFIPARHRKFVLGFSPRTPSGRR